MKRTILCSVLALGMFAPVASVDAAKAKKQQSEVEKALKERYKDAQTQITGTHEVNGVQVHDVKVTTKQGDSTAQITEYGDFLMYGVPHEHANVQSAISQDVAGLFAAKPDDVEMYRVTNYYVDFKGAKGKNYTARFDAVGQLKDIMSSEELQREGGKQAHGQKITDENAVRQATQYVKRELPNAQVDSVYQGEQGSDFWYVQTKDGGELIVNRGGQVYSFREPIQKEEFPEPIAASIKTVFTAPIDKLWRGEYEYYQFNQQSQRGTPIVVQMRPNGDIMAVRNEAAAQEEQAVQAKSKTKGDKKAKKPAANSQG
ncbi:MAG TPA: hypothetical protein VER17_00890 [Tepidisphaeraceae bacterium]|nr:hypothetical protein [Tepidisphaeraceae bacterium]